MVQAHVQRESGRQIGLDQNQVRDVGSRRLLDASGKGFRANEGHDAGPDCDSFAERNVFIVRM